MAGSRLGWGIRGRPLPPEQARTFTVTWRPACSGPVTLESTRPQEIEERHRARVRVPKLGYDGFDRNLGRRVPPTPRGPQAGPCACACPTRTSHCGFVRGEITFKAGSVPVRMCITATPLYTEFSLSMMRSWNHPCCAVRTCSPRRPARSSPTPRAQAIGVIVCRASVTCLRHGQGATEALKRDPVPNLLLHKAASMIPEGLSKATWPSWAGRCPDTCFLHGEMAQAFNISDVNPARFDQEKAIAINASTFVCWTARTSTGALVSFTVALAGVG